jgi:cytochrome b561
MRNGFKTRNAKMAPIENREDRYGAVALLLHWSMALLVIGLAALGLPIRRKGAFIALCWTVMF